MNYRSCWLTVNRACNLRCKWCYARSTNYLASDDMELETAKQIIDICNDLKIRHIILIGGEPTLYKYLFEVIDYCHLRNIGCGIVTNGLACKDISFVSELKKHDIHSISLSLKGENRDVFKEITGRDAFDDTKEAIKCCLNNDIKVTASMVITEENVNSFIGGIETLKSIGVKDFHFSFCYDFDMDMDHSKYLKIHNPKKLITDFMNNYSKLDEITQHRFTFQNGLPLCLWSDEDIKTLKEKRQISTVCQLLSKSGLIFDTNGNIIPCNAMPSIKLGKLNSDFHNSKELMEYMEKPELKKVYNRLCGVPDLKCLECSKLENCGGGCVCQWTNYSFDELMNKAVIK